MNMGYLLLLLLIIGLIIYSVFFKAKKKLTTQRTNTEKAVVTYWSRLKRCIDDFSKNVRMADDVIEEAHDIFTQMSNDLYGSYEEYMMKLKTNKANLERSADQLLATVNKLKSNAKSLKELEDTNPKKRAIASTIIGLEKQEADVRSKCVELDELYADAEHQYHIDAAVLIKKKSEFDVLFRSPKNMLSVAFEKIDSLKDEYTNMVNVETYRAEVKESLNPNLSPAEEYNVTDEEIADFYNKI